MIYMHNSSKHACACSARSHARQFFAITSIQSSIQSGQAHLYIVYTHRLLYRRFSYQISLIAYSPISNSLLPNASAVPELLISDHLTLVLKVSLLCHSHG